MINPKLQAELRERFNPDGSDLRIIQLRMLDMLKYIDKICRENNIKYWLSSGTCLGAVRHGGFIPWDDDVDIEMLENDYIKFLKVVRNYPDKNYIIQDSNNESFYRYPFCKLRDKGTIEEVSSNDRLHNLYKYKGCAIDIFPLIPSNSLAISKFGFFLQKIILKTTTSQNKILRKLSFPLYDCFESLVFTILRSVNRLNANGQLRHKIPNPFYKARYYNDIFPLQMTVFEDSIFPIPGHYSNYLHKIYGDYEKIPEADKIHTHITKIKFITSEKNGNSKK
ncbi:MAG: LicD family protein [Bacteroides sp.]|nr:LicD family protein [Bacteroides sp.]